MPRQKLSISKKGDKWREECIDSALNTLIIYNNSRRSDRSKKQKNYDLANGKLQRSDLEYAVNPLGLEIANVTFPATIQPYDVWTPIFQELFGEDARRPFSFVVRAVNENAISEKEQGLKAKVVEALQNLLTSPDGKIDDQLTAIEKMAMSYQDMRESVATQILNYLKRDLHIEMTFQKGWEDALVAGEEMYSVEEISNEPKVRRVNPMEVYFILPHNSDLIDDAEVIVEQTYMSVSQIIDNFYETLTPEEINLLESSMLSGDSHSTTVFDVVIHEKDISPDFLSSNSPTYDSRGNIRVSKVTWKSKKKIGRLLYIDEQGEQQETIVSEEYKAGIDEKIEWLWINEYWEGYKIGNEIYKNIRPKKLQFRRMDNLSHCKSGYIGSVYNCNNSQSVSLMDRLTPFIYLYVIIWYNTELAISTNMGKIAIIDVSLIPDGWEIDKWLHYARAMKVGFVDSYNEGKKGERTGKINPSQQNRELNLETGNYIQQHVTLLQYIESKIKNLAGVPEQRMGDMNASDLVGTTQSAINQSSYVTEKWFQIHNYNKQRVLEALVETAKSTWDGKSKKLQYVTDELATIFFSVDMNEFVNSEFGVFVSNSAKDQEALSTLKQLMQAALQNDKASLSTIIDVLNSESIADTKQKLIKSEQDMAKRADDSQKAQLDHEKELQAMQQEHERSIWDHDDEQKQLDRENNIEIAEIKALGMVDGMSKTPDSDNNGIPDVLEIEKLKQKDMVDREKMSLERTKLRVTQLEARKEREHQAEMKKEELKKAKLDNETKIKVAKLKPKPKPPAKK